MSTFLAIDLVFKVSFYLLPCRDRVSSQFCFSYPVVMIIPELYFVHYTFAQYICMCA